MKSLKLIVIILLALITLSGCVKESKVSDEQSDGVAEYMAGLLLKYDDNYKQGLIPLGTLSEDDTKTIIEPEQNIDLSKGDAEQKPHGEEDSNHQGTHSLTEVMGNKSFEINYKGYELVSKYPKNTGSLGISLTAQEEYDFLVVSFNAKNITKNKLRLNYNEDNLYYKLTVDGERLYSPLITLLDNELQLIDFPVKGGETEEVILIFEVDKEMKKKELNLEISNDDKSSVIELK